MMNLKYYLRGLGIGIIVTALIMGMTAGRKESLSNAEIKERAKALGMVEEENTLLKDLENQEQDQTAKEDAPEPVEKEEVQEVSTPEAPEVLEESPQPEETAPAEMDEEPKEQASDTDQAEEPTTLPEETTQPDIKPEEENQDSQGSQYGQGSVTIQIARGDGSYTVSKKLEEAGLVESATAYDQFLYQNGYDKKIRAGTVEIPAGADDGQIARIICGME